MFSSKFRIYYEDTDAGGVVYYANYLKLAERARTEWLRAQGYEQNTLLATHGVMFVVRHVTLDLRAPAQLDDLLRVTVQPDTPHGARLRMTQEIWKQNTQLATLEVELACVNRDFRPVRIPISLGTTS